MKRIKESRAASFAVIGIIYVLAAALGIAVYSLLPFGFVWNLLIADVAATVFTFIFSLIFRNASVYDPYWSVQPPVIVAAFGLAGGTGLAGLLLIISIFAWGIRLTANWAYTFGSLGQEDWRYRKLREDTGALYPIVNFLGIHMVPTLIVYACVLPAVFVIKYAPEANNGSFAGALICLGAASLQLTADLQMHSFRKKKTGGLIRTGLWKYARHPNYLGEITMWWGVALQAVSVMPERWWLAAGALANTLLFLLVSIPMADRRQSSKPGYDEYRSETRALLPIPKKAR